MKLGTLVRIAEPKDCTAAFEKLLSHVFDVGGEEYLI